MIIIIPSAIYLGIVVKKGIQTADKIHVNISKSSLRKKAVELNTKQPASFLLIGADTRDGGYGNSDTMIIVTLNPKTKTTTMISIPRDTRVKIPGYSKGLNNTPYFKINAANLIGGPKLAITTVEQMFDIPIDYFISMDFKGFSDLVTAVGGIDVNNQHKFSLDGVTLGPGQYHLNGDKALEYVRYRHEDPEGDFGRQGRQREVIQQIVSKAVTPASLSSFNKIFDAIGNNVKSNLTISQLYDLKQGYSVAGKKIVSEKMNSIGETIHGLDYQLILHDERTRVSNLLRQSLDLSPISSTFFPNIDTQLKN